MDWLVSAFGLASLWLLGRKDRRGWLCKIGAGVCGIGLNISYGLWGLVPLGVIGFFMCVYNWRKWGGEKPCVLCSK